MTRPRIAINGFGRIGRAFARVAALDADCPFDLVVANDLAKPETLAYLLKYDSVHGKLTVPVVLEDATLKVGRHSLFLSAEKNPAALPWRALGVDLVIEATGHFVGRSKAALHLQAGARKVVISAPGDSKDKPDATVVYGLNEASLLPEHDVISAASCTTTCLAPIAQALHAAFGIRTGTMTTVHAMTGDQVLLDVAHPKDTRRGRTASMNIVPTSTGAAKAIGLVLPHLHGKLHGIALRVPVPDVSLCDLVVVTERACTLDEVNDALKAAATAFLPGVLRIETDPVVSTDLIGDPTGSVVDLALTHVQGDHLVKVVAWYDNEWGYANRLYALASAVALGLAPVERAPTPIAAAAAPAG